MDDIYVVVAENDKPITLVTGRVYVDDKGPLVFEQYTRTANLASIKARAKQMSMKYGKCRIAKLVFIDEEQGEK